MKKVMAFGTFDQLHPGHEFFLSQARQQGDWLIVVIARDATVTKVKGRTPVEPENERLRRIQELPGVDLGVLGGLGDKYQVIRRYAPNIICLGYDQTHFTQDLARAFPYIHIHRIAAYHPELYKSSLRRTYDRSQNSA